MQICKENCRRERIGYPLIWKSQFWTILGENLVSVDVWKKCLKFHPFFLGGGVRTKSVKWLIVAIWLSWTLMACHDGWLSWMTFMDDFLGLILTTWAGYIQMDLRTYLTDIGTCQVAIATENNDNLVVIFDLSPLIQKLRNILETFGLLYTSFTYWWP